MNDSDTTVVNPRDDGTVKTGRADPDTATPYQVRDPNTVPEVSPGPDTREEPDSPK